MIFFSFIFRVIVIFFVFICLNNVLRGVVGGRVPGKIIVPKNIKIF
jgi:hypothetical protein